jgi:hypothetical protein
LAGWDNVVRVQEDGEEIFVLLREEDERIRGMLIVVAEADEWVLVRVWGKLDRVIEQAMEMAFEKADRPGLFDPTVSAYHEQSASRAEPGSGTFEKSGVEAEVSKVAAAGD